MKLVPELSSYKVKNGNAPLVVLTAYDYTFAKLFDASGIDIFLVGDSLGSVIQGQKSTLPVTLDHMLYHTSCVTRAAENTFVVADMPFLSYQVSVSEAVLSAGKLLQTGAHAVKLEGGVSIADTVSRLVELDIPVMGHVGMTPQSIHRMGGYKVQGKNEAKGKGAAEAIMRDAKAIEKAGAFSLVLECIPHTLAAEITSELSIPTIGIGAGPECDGQVLVSYDLLGLTQGKSPVFVKHFAQIGEQVMGAVRTYADEVRGKKFPTLSQSYEGVKKK